jgi:hypothetical protein
MSSFDLPSPKTKKKKKEIKSNLFKIVVSMRRWSASSTFFLGVAMSHLITKKGKKKPIQTFGGSPKRSL